MSFCNEYQIVSILTKQLKNPGNWPVRYFILYANPWSNGIGYCYLGTKYRGIFDNFYINKYGGW